MRLPHHSDIVGLTVRAAHLVSGHSQCGITQERDKGAVNGQSHENHRLDRSLGDNRNHNVCQSCPSIQTCSSLPIIHPKKEGFQRVPGLLRPEVSSVGSVDSCSFGAGINAGPLPRSINKAGRISGDGFTPKVIWAIVKANAKSCGLATIGPHEVALAWLRHQTVPAIPIIGARKGSQLRG